MAESHTITAPALDAERVFRFLQDMEEAMLLLKQYSALLVDMSSIPEPPSDDGFCAMGRIFDQLNDSAQSAYTDWRTLHALVGRHAVSAGSDA